MLRIEIVDDNCGEDECHMFKVPIDAPKDELINAIGWLFPTATSIWFVVEQE